MIESFPLSEKWKLNPRTALRQNQTLLKFKKLNLVDSLQLFSEDSNLKIELTNSYKNRLFFLNPATRNLNEIEDKKVLAFEFYEKSAQIQMVGLSDMVILNDSIAVFSHYASSQLLIYNFKSKKLKYIKSNITSFKLSRISENKFLLSSFSVENSQYHIATLSENFNQVAIKSSELGMFENNKAFPFYSDGWIDSGENETIIFAGMHTPTISRFDSVGNVVFNRLSVRFTSLPKYINEKNKMGGFTSIVKKTPLNALSLCVGGGFIFLLNDYDQLEKQCIIDVYSTQNGDYTFSLKVSRKINTIEFVQNQLVLFTNSSYYSTRIVE
ncbi:MAG: hypothetical protein L6Q77_11265 [Bacteroidetes bacterium]|nr:hypothetical protein [Bacteroidota bacterium]